MSTPLDLTPAAFPEANRTLAAPPGMDNCDPLRIYTDGQVCLSAWQVPWRARLAILLRGRVWLWVWFGQTQPPVALTAHNPFATDPPA